jgi:hypothetical protein
MSEIPRGYSLSAVSLQAKRLKNFTRYFLVKAV